MQHAPAPTSTIPVPLLPALCGRQALPWIRIVPGCGYDEALSPERQCRWVRLPGRDARPTRTERPDERQG